MILLNVISGVLIIVAWLFWPDSLEAITPLLYMTVGIIIVILTLFIQLLISGATRRSHSITWGQVDERQLDIVRLSYQLRRFSRHIRLVIILFSFLFVVITLFLIDFSFSLVLAVFFFYTAIQSFLMTVHGTRFLGWWQANLIFHFLANYDKIRSREDRGAIVQMAASSIAGYLRAIFPGVDKLSVNDQLAVLTLALTIGTQEQKKRAKEIATELASFHWAPSPQFGKYIMGLLVGLTNDSVFSDLESQVEAFGIKIRPSEIRAPSTIDRFEWIITYLLPIITAILAILALFKP